MGNLQSELKTIDYSPNQLRRIYNDKKTFKTGGQYVYLIIKNGALNRPFSNHADDHQVHLQTFIVDSPAKIFQMAYNSDPSVFGPGFIKSMTRYEITGDSWSPWSVNQADGTNANYSGTVSVDGGDLLLKNSKKTDAKFCIGTTCLSQSALNDILIASNSSLSLLSTVDTPYAKDPVTNLGACNWGYSGTISYSNDGKGLTGCVKCPSGYYKGEVGNTGCKPCDVGYYCPTGGTTNRVAGSPGMNLRQVQCDAGKYCPAASFEQKACPPGYYCPTGSATGIACASGSYNSFEGKTLKSDCLPCGPGYYCPETGSSKITAAPSGHYTNNTNNYDLQKCQGGSYNNNTGGTGTNSCLSCRTGTYCPDRGNFKETSCPGGYFCPTAGLSGLPGASNGPTRCDAGRYCPEGTGAQTICPAGYFCVIQSATFANCTAGNYCPQGTGVQTPCPPGSYCPALTGAPTLCPIGTYRKDPGATGLVNCLPCASGYHCATGSTLNSTASRPGYYSTGGFEIQCPAGYSCSATGLSGLPGVTNGPTICGTGKFSAAGATGCSNCGAGKSSAAGSSSCTNCSAGQSSTEGGLCTNCGPGKFSATGASSCSLCATGTFSSAAAAGSCATCGSGTYNDTSGSTSCTGVQGGFYSLNGVKNVCPSGKYCPTGSTSPIDCPIGSYCPYGSASPITCPPGYYTNTLRNNTCFQAGLGYYAHNGILNECNSSNDEFCPNRGMTKADVRSAGAWGTPSLCFNGSTACRCASDSTIAWCDARIVDLNKCSDSYWASTNPTTPCPKADDKITYYTKVY
jgi:hypothetical protein